MGTKITSKQQMVGETPLKKKNPNFFCPTSKKKLFLFCVTPGTTRDMTDTHKHQNSHRLKWCLQVPKFTLPWFR